MSDFERFCDALKADLVTNIPALTDAETHLYAAWDPERFEADGKRHLAVWPEGEAEAPEPLATGSHALNQSYVVAVWESSGAEPTRLELDEEGAKTLLDLHNDVRDRLYVEVNQTLGDFERVWYAGSEFGTIPGLVRFFAIRVSVRAHQAFL